MGAVVAVLKPVLLAFVKSEAVRRLVIDLLRALASLSETKLDDAAVDLIEDNIF